MTPDERAHCLELAERLETLAQSPALRDQGFIDVLEAAQLLRDHVEVEASLDRPHLNTPTVDVPALYDVARELCHEHGLPWTDPRTGIVYLPPRRDP